MTAAQFRKIALSLREAEERSHMGHPDFRVAGKIFATLGSPDNGWGMVKLTPEQQRVYVQSHPKVFKPAQGAWGLQGSTLVHLKDADVEIIGEAMRAAWHGRAPKSLVNK
jgi:hypothetical protein